MLRVHHCIFYVSVINKVMKHVNILKYYEDEKEYFFQHDFNDIMNNAKEGGTIYGIFFKRSWN